MQSKQYSTKRTKLSSLNMEETKNIILVSHQLTLHDKKYKGIHKR